jgi:outer membrane protein assembly factor BamB
MHRLLLLFALLAAGAIAVLAQADQNAVRDRANAQRTGVSSSSPIIRPAKVVWESENLFTINRLLIGTLSGENYSRGVPSTAVFPGVSASSLGMNYYPPLVASGTIYFTLFLGDGALFAVDASTGELKWKSIAKGERFTYPTVAGDVLYVGLQSALRAIDLKSRRELWKFDAGAPLPFDHSPLVVNGLVYFGSQNGNFYALDAATGAEKWVFKAGHKTYWYSPVLGGDLIYSAEGDGPVHGWNRETGERKWSAEVTNGVTGLVVEGASLYFIDNDGYVNALDALTGKSRPPFRQPVRIGTDPAIFEGKIYFGGWNSTKLVAADVVTGRKLWDFDPAKPCGSPAIAGGIVYLTCSDRKAYAFDARSGRKLWAIDSGQAVMSAPVPANGALYFVADDGKVHAIK